MAAQLIAFAAMAALQVASGYHKANMIRDQNKFRRKVDDFNVAALELDAWEAEAFGEEQEARYQTVVDNTIADQKLSYAATDVEIGYGTAGDLVAETKVTGLLNQLDIEKQARQKANGFRREIRNIRLGSNMATLQSELDAGAAQSAGMMQGAGTMLSGYGRNS